MNNKVKKEVESLIKELDLDIKKEVKSLIKELNLDCSVDEFKDYVDWGNISYCQELSEDFIRDFKDKVNWHCISESQQLSENFIREFKDRVDWEYISRYQELSEDFIKDFKDNVNWINISYCQRLSEDFIRDFKDMVDWINISAFQQLSEDFINEFKDNVNWHCISKRQQLSEDFINEFKDKVDIELYHRINEVKSIEDKRQEVIQYAESHNLKYDDQYLYAFRNHDEFGRGAYSETILYEKGKYYRDWHCDMRKDEENSFGLGIWPKGNTKIRIRIEDWGVDVNKRMVKLEFGDLK